MTPDATLCHCEERSDKAISFWHSSEIYGTLYHSRTTNFSAPAGLLRKREAAGATYTAGGHHNVRHAILTIAEEKSTTKPPAIMVMIIASSFRRSAAIPTMANTRASTKQVTVSSLPKAVIGLPQPGRSIASKKMVAMATPRKVAAIFPKRIFQLLQKHQDGKEIRASGKQGAEY